MKLPRERDADRSHSIESHCSSPPASTLDENAVRTRSIPECDDDLVEEAVLPASVSSAELDRETRGDTLTHRLAPANASEHRCSESTRLIPTIPCAAECLVGTQIDTDGQHNVDHDHATEPRHSSSAISHSSTNDVGNSGPQEDLLGAKKEDAYYALSDTNHGYWTPFWLRNSTLLALVALFTSLTVSLIVIWFTNRSQNGFRPVVSKNHYAWTYGPTAVLVIVLSFWRQVDYHCKILQPWQELRNGPTSADKSMLLDYLSPLQATSLVRAIKNRHIAVAASVAGFATIKAVIVLSTGLLTLVPVSVTDTSPVMITTAFDSARIWNTIPGGDYDNIGPSGEPYVVDSLFGEPIYRNVSTSPVHEYLKTLKEETANAVGMIDGIACQSFEPADTDSIRIISTNVDAFMPNVKCEVAKPIWRMRRNDSPVFQLDSHTCSVGQEHQSPIEFPIQEGETIAQRVWRVNCSESDGMEKWSVLTAETPYDYRFAMMVGDVSHLNLTILGDANPDYNSEPLDRLMPQQTAAVICTTDYSMYRSEVREDFANSSLTIQQLEPVSNLRNLTGTMIAELIFASLSDSELSDLDISDPDQNISPLFAILLHTLDGERSMSRLLSEQALKASVEWAWAGLASHLIRESFLSPTRLDAHGTAIHMEDRLLVGAASLWIMVAGFAIVIVLAIIVMLTKSQRVAPRDPGLISTDAVVLSTSPSVQKILSRCHNMRTSQMVETLRDVRFSTCDNNSFRIDTVDDGRRKDRSSFKPKVKDWTPLPAKYAMFALTLTLPLVTIVTLEVLFRISEMHNGFSDVSGSEDMANYLSRYGSALAVLLIATCFNSLDFTTSLFAPYSCLQSGSVPASRGISLQVIGSLPPVALYKSVRSRHASSFLSNVAGMIGSTLTIIASGLWVVDRTVVMQQPAVATLSNIWDIDWSNSSTSGDGGAGIMLDQFQHGSTSLPSLVTQGVVLPGISNIRIQPDGAPSLVNWESAALSQNFTFQLDALRPLLTCEVVEDENIAINFTEGQNSFQRNIIVRATPTLPPGCQHGGKDGVNSTYDFSSNLWFTGGNETTYMGNFYDLHLGPWTSDYLEYGEGASWITERQADNPAGCPSIGAILARVSRYDVDHDDVTALMCSQRMQQVQVNVTYTGSNLTHPVMRTSEPPILIEDSVQALTNGTDGVDSFPYRVQQYLQEKNDGGNLTKFTYNGSDWRGASSYLDVFMNHVILGPNGTAPDDMLGKNNQDTLIEAMNDLYARYMSLVIHLRFRQPTAGGQSDANQVPGSAYSFSSRIQVNPVSKLVMQIMLGVMILLGLLTFFLTDLRGTLPRKPSSIASRMALLAGSDLCAEDKGLLLGNAMRISDKEFARVLDGWLFSLGWWRKSETSDAKQHGGSVTADDVTSRDCSISRSVRFGIDVGAPEQLGFRRRR